MMTIKNVYLTNSHHYPFILVLEVCVDIINTDLVMGMEYGLCHKVDILLFNPPYVPTPPDEGKISLTYSRSIAYEINSLFLTAVGGCGISASWAGGLDGRVVIDRFLPLLEVIFFCIIQMWRVNVLELKWENYNSNHLPHFKSAVSCFWTSKLKTIVDLCSDLLYWSHFHFCPVAFITGRWQVLHGISWRE